MREGRFVAARVRTGVPKPKIYHEGRMHGLRKVPLSLALSNYPDHDLPQYVRWINGLYAFLVAAFLAYVSQTYRDDLAVAILDGSVLETALALATLISPVIIIVGVLRMHAYAYVGAVILPLYFLQFFHGEYAPFRGTIAIELGLLAAVHFTPTILVFALYPFRSFSERNPEGLHYFTMHHLIIPQEEYPPPKPTRLMLLTGLRYNHAHRLPGMIAPVLCAIVLMSIGILGLYMKFNEPVRFSGFAQLAECGDDGVISLTLTDPEHRLRIPSKWFADADCEGALQQLKPGLPISGSYRGESDFVRKPSRLAINGQSVYETMPGALTPVSVLFVLAGIAS